MPFQVLNDLSSKGGGMPMTLVPWDLLTDFERRKDRFRASEILKFFQYHGYQIYKWELNWKVDYIVGGSRRLVRRWENYHR